jgi:hypothetical protein
MLGGFFSSLLGITPSGYPVASSKQSWAPASAAGKGPAADVLLEGRASRDVEPNTIALLVLWHFTFRAVDPQHGISGRR